MSPGYHTIPIPYYHIMYVVSIYWVKIQVSTVCMIWRSTYPLSNIRWNLLKYSMQISYHTQCDIKLYTYLQFLYSLLDNTYVCDLMQATVWRIYPINILSVHLDILWILKKRACEWGNVDDRLQRYSLYIWFSDECFPALEDEFLTMHVPLPGLNRPNGWLALHSYI